MLTLTLTDLLPPALAQCTGARVRFAPGPACREFSLVRRQRRRADTLSAHVSSITAAIVTPTGRAVSKTTASDSVLGSSVSPVGPLRIADGGEQHPVEPLRIADNRGRHAVRPRRFDHHRDRHADRPGRFEDDCVRRRAWLLRLANHDLRQAVGPLRCAKNPATNTVGLPRSPLARVFLAVDPLRLANPAPATRRRVGRSRTPRPLFRPRPPRVRIPPRWSRRRLAPSCSGSRPSGSRSRPTAQRPLASPVLERANRSRRRSSSRCPGAATPRTTRGKRPCRYFR